MAFFSFFFFPRLNPPKRLKVICWRVLEQRALLPSVSILNIYEASPACVAHNTVHGAAPLCVRATPRSNNWRCRINLAQCSLRSLNDRRTPPWSSLSRGPKAEVKGWSLHLTLPFFGLCVFSLLLKTLLGEPAEPICSLVCIFPLRDGTHHKYLKTRRSLDDCSRCNLQ